MTYSEENPFADEIGTQSPFPWFWEEWLTTLHPTIEDERRLAGHAKQAIAQKKKLIYGLPTKAHGGKDWFWVQEPNAPTSFIVQDDDPYEGHGIPLEHWSA